MEPEILTVVRIPLPEVVAQLRADHGLDYDFTQLSQARIDDDTLVLEFAARPPVAVVSAPVPRSTSLQVIRVEEVEKRKPSKRKTVKRRRMKTRGWKVVARIVNSSGQKAAIYEPFVEALSQPGLTKTQKETVVRKILKENGNTPAEASVQYYMQNTLDYLSQTRGGGDSS